MPSKHQLPDVDAFWHLVNWEFAAQNLARNQPFEV